MLTYRTQTYATQQDYEDAVINTIAGFEGHAPNVYNKDGKATIGYGYTFERSNNLAVWTAAGITLSQAQINLLTQIDAATTNQQKTALAMTFSKNLNNQEARDLLRQTYPEYEGPANTLNMPLSPERVAFVSICYNRGVGRVQRAMGGFYQAIIDQDRAEAWYEIRYVAVGNPAPAHLFGIAKRRYAEAQLFGLYDDPTAVTSVEAIQVYKMIQRHRDEIWDHEGHQFGRLPNGEIGQIRDTNGRVCIDAANTDCGGFLGLHIQTLEEALNNARTKLLADLRVQYSTNADLVAKLTDENIVSTSIYLNPAKLTDYDRRSTLDARPYETGNYLANGSNDLMIGMDQRDIIIGGKGNDILLGEGGNDDLLGGDGEDILIGGDGNDILEGGKGNDTLEGGIGNDDYYFQSGDGNDTITDMDGENRIFWTDSNGIPHVMKTFYKSGDAEWTSPDGTVEVNKHSPYKIVLPDGGTITLGEDFQPGDFGIQLKDAPQVPTTTNTIFGDQNPQDLEDVLTGTTGNDRIEGRDDDDTISSLQGDDVLLGGTGRDAISAGEGNDILEGGAGSDILFGEEGNDQVYGENAGLMFDLISAGENATSIDQTGDLIVGNEGDDQLYGSNSNDALLGGEGHDLLAGGGGNDVIYGDYDSSGAYIDWDFKVTPDDITLRRSGNNMVVLPHIMNNSQNSNMHHILFS